VVTCQQDRSQHRNREIAWNLLRAKLFELEQKKQQAARDNMAANQTEIGWGHQIRSYVLQPYQMIKDLRTGVETSNTVGVLDGDLNAFIQAALADKVGSTR
jgi:peptide chain release factor 2